MHILQVMNFTLGLRHNARRVTLLLEMTVQFELSLTFFPKKQRGTEIAVCTPLFLGFVP